MSNLKPWRRQALNIGRLRKISLAAIEEYIAQRTIPARQQAN